MNLKSGSKVFLDTNVLIYAIESSGPEAQKSKIAQALVRGRNVCLSTQVLGEFYRTVTSSRRASALTHAEAIAWIEFWKHHDVRPITLPHVDSALEIVKRFKLGYYDALILASARLANCLVVQSEDLNPGQDYGGVRVENPFAA